jgi:N-methylhydantoinase A
MQLRRMPRRGVVWAREECVQYFIGIDIGGTFTDCAVLEDGGRIATIAKAPSTRRDLAKGVMDAVSAAAANLGTDAAGLLGRTRFFIHGCTVATNAIVTRSGVKTGLLTTRGHEDAIFIGKVSQKVAGRSEREMIHQSHLDKADPPLIDRRMVRGITERIDRGGQVVVELDEEDAEKAVAALLRDGAEAVAISFLWSFLNGEHERRVAEAIRTRSPGLFVAVSHEIAPVLGEYERTATTALSGYVGPKVTSYLDRLAGRLAESGYRYPLLLAHCMGGLTTMEEVRTKPLLTLDSGPVSGILGARFFGAAYGQWNIICADMGGTTFDVSMVEGGRYVLDEEPVIDKYAYLMPKVAVESVGAGGGSIVWLDDNGLLRVGPHSAGADPGPASYGAGGTDLTITDVDLILGYLNPERFLGGAMRLDVAAAEAAADRLAARLGTDRTSVAAGAFRIVNAHMADLVRRASVDRGRDPRDFVLFAYGGAGPMHIAYLARELRIREIYVPALAAVFSAAGMLTGGVLHSAETTFPAAFPLTEGQSEGLRAAFGEMRGKLDRLFDAEGIAPADRRFASYLHMKFRLQPTALAVPLADDGDLFGRQEEVVAAFEGQYRALYGPNAGYRAAGIEIVKCRLDGAAATVLPALSPHPEVSGADARDAESGKRLAYLPETGAYAMTPVYDGARLLPGMILAGPAIVERMGDTIVLPSFATARVDRFGNVLMDLGAGKA